MKSTANLRDLGQSLWLDNITRNLLQGGLLRRYIDELSVTGLTSNPTIFDHAIKNSSGYDVAIREKLEEVRLNNWWVKMTGLLARCEAGSQVFLRVTNFKSLRQVASYAI